MNSNDFIRLEHRQKTATVRKATFLADRFTAEYYIQLYNIDSFYAEVFFEKGTKQVRKFRAFEHTLFVLPYLEELKIAV